MCPEDPKVIKKENKLDKGEVGSFSCDCAPFVVFHIYKVKHSPPSVLL